MYVNLYIIYFFLTYEENMSMFGIIWSDRTRTVWFVFAPFSYCMDANEFRVDTGLRGFLVCFNFSRCQCLRNKTGLFISFFLCVCACFETKKKSALNTLNIWPWDLMEVTVGKQTSWYLSFENTSNIIRHK